MTIPTFLLYFKTLESFHEIIIQIQKVAPKEYVLTWISFQHSTNSTNMYYTTARKLNRNYKNDPYRPFIHQLPYHAFLQPHGSFNVNWISMLPTCSSFLSVKIHVIIIRYTLMPYIASSQQTHYALICEFIYIVHMCFILKIFI